MGAWPQLKISKYIKVNDFLEYLTVGQGFIYVFINISASGGVELLPSMLKGIGALASRVQTEKELSKY